MFFNAHTFYQALENDSKVNDFDFNLEDFKKSRHLLGDTDIPLQALTASNILTYNGKQYFIDEITNPVEVFNKNAKCYIDGDPTPCSPTYIFEKEDEDEVVTVFKDKLQEVELVIIYDKVTKETIEFPRVDDKSARFATVQDKNIDYESLDKQFRYAVNEGNRGLLRRVNQSRRKTSQTTCNWFKLIQLAVEYDSTFCIACGGRDNADEEVEKLVKNVSDKFGQPGLCLKVEISHLGGFCVPGQDPYKEPGAIGLSGCNGLGLLHAVGDIFGDSGRSDVEHDLMFLITDNKLECDDNGCVVGCANSGSICTQNAYGVMYTKFTESVDLRSVAFAHEIAHVAGAFHDSQEGFIMYESIRSASEFSSQSVNAINNERSEWESIEGCVVDHTEGPSGAPSHEPSKSPTSFPSSEPSLEPSAKPSFVPSDLPSAVPSIWPTQSPSIEPSVFPSSLHSSYPSTVPTNEFSNEPSMIFSSIPSQAESVEPSTKPSTKLPSITGLPPSDPDCRTRFDPLSFLQTFLRLKLS